MNPDEKPRDNPTWTMFFEGPLYQKYDEYMRNHDFSKILLNKKLQLANSSQKEEKVRPSDKNLDPWENPDYDKVPPIKSAFKPPSLDSYEYEEDRRRRRRRTWCYVCSAMLVIALLSLATALVIHYVFIEPKDGDVKTQVNISFSGNNTLVDAMERAKPVTTETSTKISDNVLFKATTRATTEGFNSEDINNLLAVLNQNTDHDLDKMFKLFPKQSRQEPKATEAQKVSLETLVVDNISPLVMTSTAVAETPLSDNATSILSSTTSSSSFDSKYPQIATSSFVSSSIQPYQERKATASQTVSLEKQLATSSLPPVYNSTTETGTIPLDKVTLPSSSLPPAAATAAAPSINLSPTTSPTSSSSSSSLSSSSSSSSATSTTKSSQKTTRSSLTSSSTLSTSVASSSSSNSMSSQFTTTSSSSSSSSSSSPTSSLSSSSATSTTKSSPKTTQSSSTSSSNSSSSAAVSSNFMSSLLITTPMPSSSIPSLSSSTSSSTITSLSNPPSSITTTVSSSSSSLSPEYSHFSHSIVVPTSTIFQSSINISTISNTVHLMALNKSTTSQTTFLTSSTNTTNTVPQSIAMNSSSKIAEEPSTPFTEALLQSTTETPFPSTNFSSTSILSTTSSFNATQSPKLDSEQAPLALSNTSYLNYSESNINTSAVSISTSRVDQRQTTKEIIPTILWNITEKISVFLSNTTRPFHYTSQLPTVSLSVTPSKAKPTSNTSSFPTTKIDTNESNPPSSTQLTSSTPTVPTDRTTTTSKKAPTTQQTSNTTPVSPDEPATTTTNAPSTTSTMSTSTAEPTEPPTTLPPVYSKYKWSSATTTNAPSTTSTMSTSTAEPTEPPTTLPPVYNLMKMGDVTAYTYETAKVHCDVRIALKWSSLAIKGTKGFRPLEVTLSPTGRLSWRSKRHRHKAEYKIEEGYHGAGQNVTLDLVIRNVKCGDGDVYTCFLLSDVINQQKRSRLTTVGKPGKKIKLSLGPSIIEDRAIRLTVTWNGGFPVPWTNMSWSAVDRNNNSYDLSKYGDYREFVLEVDDKFCRTKMKQYVVIFPKMHLNGTTIIVKPDTRTVKSFVNQDMRQELTNVEPGVQSILVIPLDYCPDDKEQAIPHPYEDCTKFIWCLPGDLVVQPCPFGTCFSEITKECVRI